MTISTLGQELKIICGVPRAPGDTLSAEDALQVLDLLAGTKGFSVEPGGWIPQLPQVKGSGLWADSAITDGRTLISAPVGNVTESITLTSNAATLQGRYFWEKELSRFSQLCADFWQTFGQIQPVYLKWFAPDAPGPQYALLYKIEIARRSDPFSGDSVQEFTISVEREPYWRGLAPGENPKKWTFEFRKEQYTVADLDLSNTSTRNLAVDSLENRREWNTTTTAQISSNALDIPGTNIPGDVPALACISLDPSDAEGITLDRVYLARSTKPLTMTIRDGTGVATSQFGIFNAGDGDTGVDATIVADANAPASNKSASGQRVTVSFATNTTLIPRISWDGNGNDESDFDGNTFRGRYACFLRARLSAVGTVHANLVAVSNAGNDPFTLPTVLIQQGVGATPSWYLHYMGILDIPFWQRAIVSADGKGLQTTTRANGTTNFKLRVQADRTSGTPSLFISDLILMPMDEAFCYVDGIQASNPIIDNTGYFGHGLDEHVGGYASNGLVPIYNFINSLQLIGQMITLAPGINNRIYYLAAGSNKGSPIAMNTTIRVNIVPRWSGIRDI